MISWLGLLDDSEFLNRPPYDCATGAIANTGDGTAIPGRPRKVLDQFLIGVVLVSLQIAQHVNLHAIFCPGDFLLLLGCV